MMPLRGGGWTQGDNCQAATSSDGLIIATSVGNNPSDATAFCTIMDKTAAAAALIDPHRPSTAVTGWDRGRAGGRRLSQRGQPHRPGTGSADRGRQEP